MSRDNPLGDRSAEVAARSCPASATIQAWLDDELSMAETTKLERHLSCCSTCSEQAGILASQCDELVRQLCQPTDDPILEESGLRELKQLAASLLSSGSALAEETATFQELPKTLAGYEITELLGRGGMGEVYRGVHARLNRPVAIKVIGAKLSDRLGGKARFEREIKSVGAIRHPNVVAATDAGEFDGHLYLVMELLEGCDLASLLRRRKVLPIDQACEIAMQAAVGLSCIHQSGMVHRDVKPSNLFLTTFGEVKILDLGLAKLVADDADDITETGMAVGTPKYAAPEQVHDPQKVDAGADIFGLGCTLYRMLMGTPPIRANLVAPTRQSKDLLQEITEARSDIPRELAHLLVEMLQADVHLRPASAVDIAKQLSKWAEKASLTPLTGGVKRSPDQDEDCDSLTSDTAPVLEEDTAVAPRLRRNFLTWVAAGVGSAAAIGGLAAFWIQRRWPRVIPKDQWVELLTEEPDPIGAMGERRGTVIDFASDKQELLVVTQTGCMLKLGEADGPFRLQISMKQPKWTGGIGVFFGFHEELVSEQETVWKFHNIRLRAFGSRDGFSEFTLARTLETVHIVNGEEGNARTLPMGAAIRVARPGLQPVVLDLEVGPFGLKECRWDGTPLPALASEDVTRQAGSVPSFGAFGLICIGATVVFSSARVLVYSDR